MIIYSITIHLFYFEELNLFLFTFFLVSFKNSINLIILSFYPLSSSYTSFKSFCIFSPNFTISAYNFYSFYFLSFLSISIYFFILLGAIISAINIPGGCYPNSSSYSGSYMNGIDSILSSSLTSFQSNSINSVFFS